MIPGILSEFLTGDNQIQCPSLCQVQSAMWQLIFEMVGGLSEKVGVNVEAFFLHLMNAWTGEIDLPPSQYELSLVLVHVIAVFLGSQSHKIDRWMINKPRTSGICVQKKSNLVRTEANTGACCCKCFIKLIG